MRNSLGLHLNYRRQHVQEFTTWRQTSLQVL